MSAPSARVDDFLRQADEHFERDPTKLFVPTQRPFGVSANDAIEYRSEEEAFPPIPAPHVPTGNLVLIQLRMPARFTAGGNKLLDEALQTERDNTQVGKVVAIGPLAFRARDTGELWPEKAWCKVGDYVRVPKYQGDRVRVRFRNRITDPQTGTTTAEFDHCTFVGFKDIALLGLYESAEHALAAKSFWE